MRFLGPIVPLLILLAAFLSGCGDSKSDVVAIRVAALSYAFEHDTELKNEPANWVFSVEADAETGAVVAALSDYPISRVKLEIEDRGSIARVDSQSGKRYAHWQVKIERKESGEVWANVGCVKGGLNGYGQMLLMEKRRGRWIVVSSTPTWIS